MFEIAVRKALASSLLPLLLLTTLVWGGCISCEQFFMWPGAKSCCAPDGHCKTKAPSSQDSPRECNRIVFDHHKSVDFHIDLHMTGMAKIELPVPIIEQEFWQSPNPIEPSAPDLQVLNSTFLI